MISRLTNLTLLTLSTFTRHLCFNNGILSTFGSTFKIVGRGHREGRGDPNGIRLEDDSWISGRVNASLAHADVGLVDEDKLMRLILSTQHRSDIESAAFDGMANVM